MHRLGRCRGQPDDGDEAGGEGQRVHGGRRLILLQNIADIDDEVLYRAVPSDGRRC